MKVMTLNLWCGNVYDVLMPFLESKKDEIDVFCFQEVHDTTDPDQPRKMGSTINDVHDMFAQLKELFPDHMGLFTPRHGSFGLAMFIRKTIELNAYSVKTIKDGFGRVLPEADQPSIAQYIDIKTEDKKFRIVNIHGLWVPNVGKGDSPDRLEQSNAIIDIVTDSTSPVILCGDFNLDRDTKSINMIEDVGLINWIKKNDVASTRSELYTKTFSRFADYILTSEQIEVKKFEVLQDTVSDHLPLVIHIA
jgi:endonuclease/exonuclease/phosphatase family metal-dependent hydrolase